MAILFELLKILFYFMTVVLGIFRLRGEVIFGIEGNPLVIYKDLIQQLMMPGYLLLCGLMIGYFMSQIWLASVDESDDIARGKVYIWSFVIGLVIGFLLAGIWMMIG